MDANAQKTEIKTIAEKNRIIGRITDILLTRNHFLLMGHKNPDEDCVAAMVAFGLLAAKLEKTSYILSCDEISTNYDYLLKICKYNSIVIVKDCEHLPEKLGAIAFMDTAKPSMLPDTDGLNLLYADKSIPKIEFDHHLESDSGYCGDKDLSLVTAATSSSELVGLLGIKMSGRSDVPASMQGARLLSRNFVLAVLTGIIGDSKMGKYLKSSRERWFYKFFSGLFEEILEKETFKGSANLSSMEEVYKEIFKLSGEEERCHARFMTNVRCDGKLCRVVLDEKESAAMVADFDHETFVSISRTVADELAEKTRLIGLVCFYDDPAFSNFIQFRMRRSQYFKGLDLRDVLSKLGIENGGGHEGAVGFRFERNEIADVRGYMEELVKKLEEMIHADDN